MMTTSDSEVPTREQLLETMRLLEVPLEEISRRAKTKQNAEYWREYRRRKREGVVGQVGRKKGWTKYD